MTASGLALQYNWNMQIVVDDLLVQYEQSGSGGRVVLLLHGWGDDVRSWQALMAELAQTYHVVALNLPGFGGSQIPPEAWGLDEYGHFLAHFVEHIDLRPNIIIGHSNGGAIAIKGVASGALVADKLILLASAGVRSHNQGRKLLLKAVAKTGKAVTLALPGTARQKLRRHLYAQAGSELLLVPQMEATFKKVVGEDIISAAQKITIPTLLIYGEQDTATPPLYGRLLHEAIAESVFEVVGSAGHFVHHDQPATVGRLIKDFMA
jgi:pimeloyl-ACP methyl ester carboxylesterase